MQTNKNLTTAPWPDYELLDSGDNMKLERFRKIILARPETQAIWKPKRPELWAKADAEFSFREGKGSWKKKKQAPDSWKMSWQDAHFTVRLTSFKHTGIFPEQAVNWEWLHEKINKFCKGDDFSVARTNRRMRSSEVSPSQNLSRQENTPNRFPNVLNLFGYTGIASIVAAQAGAKVTHVDASKQSNVWAKENAKLSGVPDDRIRYILDDALKFAKREVRRGAEYDGIILDPPAFGRGTKGEVWKIEESLPELLETLKSILSKKPGSFFLLDGYAAGYAPSSFLQLVESIFGKVECEYGELRIQETNSERVIPAGMYVRFVV